MRLAFKNWGFGFSEKEVEITLNIGTLEAVCKDLGIEFFEIGDTVNKNNFEFTVELLYQGYITAWKYKAERLRFHPVKLFIFFLKPKYTLVNAGYWNEYMSKEAERQFLGKMTALFGEITKMSGVKKKVKKAK